MKTWNVQFYREPLHEETQIKAKTGMEAARKLQEVLQDVTVERVWEIKESK